MGTYEELKRAISDVIKENGNNEITGTLLQQSLLAIVNNIGNNATYAGIAVPSTTPGTADANVFYIAIEPGLYYNFNSYKVRLGEIVIFANKSGSWQKYSIGMYNVIVDVNNITQEDYDILIKGDCNVLIKDGSNLYSCLRLQIGGTGTIDLYYLFLSTSRVATVYSISINANLAVVRQQFNLSIE